MAFPNNTPVEKQVFPLSWRSYISVKKEAYAAAEADAVKRNKPFPKGYVPPIDLTPVLNFTTDEFETDPAHPRSLMRARRAALEKFEEDRLKEVRHKAYETQMEQDRRQVSKALARKKAREEQDEAEQEPCEQVRKEFLERRNRKRKMSEDSSDLSDGSEDGSARHHKRSAAGNSDDKQQPGSVDRSHSRRVNRTYRQKGTVATAIVVGDRRVSHGNRRYRRVVLDSDDELDLLATPKPNGVESKKTTVANVTMGKSSLKRKRNDEHDTDESDNGPPLAQKRRKFLHVRPESDKENMSQKVIAKVIAKEATTKSTNAPKPKPKRPAVLAPQNDKTSTSAGVSNVVKKKVTEAKKASKIKVAKDVSTKGTGTKRPRMTRNQRLRAEAEEARSRSVVKYKRELSPESQRRREIFGRRW